MFECPSEYTTGVQGRFQFSRFSISDIMTSGMKNLVYYEAKLISALRKIISNKKYQTKCLVLGCCCCDVSPKTHTIRFLYYSDYIVTIHVSQHGVQIYIFVSCTHKKYQHIDVY